MQKDPMGMTIRSWLIQCECEVLRVFGVLTAGWLAVSVPLRSASEMENDANARARGMLFRKNVRISFSLDWSVTASEALLCLNGELYGAWGEAGDPACVRLRLVEKNVPYAAC